MIMMRNKGIALQVDMLTQSISEGLLLKYLLNYYEKGKPFSIPKGRAAAVPMGQLRSTLPLEEAWGRCSQSNMEWLQVHQVVRSRFRFLCSVPLFFVLFCTHLSGGTNLSNPTVASAALPMVSFPLPCVKPHSALDTLDTQTTCSSIK